MSYLLGQKGKTFIVGASQGDRNGPKLISSTIRGPYSFEEMCEQVGLMWRRYQHHAKVIVLEKDVTKPINFLDENTTDYIEANYEDIVTESLLDGVFDEVKTYTCRANMVEADQSEDPSFSAKQPQQEESPQEEM